MSRILWLAVGWSSQAAFAVLCCSLIGFLQLTTLGGISGRSTWWLLPDLLLVAAFAVPHSILLLPPVRRAMARHMPAQLTGAVYCWSGCLGLWLLMALWQPVGPELWHADATARWTILILAAAGWLLLGYSMHLSGLGWQTGLTPFLAWRNGGPDPRRRLHRRSLHRWMRHPIYLSFLVVSWLVPVMTADRLLLALGFTAYVYLGSWAKDRRLLRLIGDEYRRYMAEVPGFPVIGFGPLGIVGAADSDREDVVEQPAPA
jgi:protein-S-isoprenylcysteine O-methyltransferase Ste14